MTSANAYSPQVPAPAADALQVLNKIIEHRKAMSKICDVQTAWEKEGLLIAHLMQAALRQRGKEADL